MTKFPVDAPKAKVLRVLVKLGLKLFVSVNIFLWRERMRTERKRL